MTDYLHNHTLIQIIMLQDHRRSFVLRLPEGALMQRAASGAVGRALREFEAEALRLARTHTHTHTHTQGERERAGEGGRNEHEALAR